MASQQLPAQYNRVAAAKAAKVAAPTFASPSPTPHILDEDEEDVDEGGHWDPALTELLEQHRLMRLAPGLRALGKLRNILVQLASRTLVTDLVSSLR